MNYYYISPGLKPMETLIKIQGATNRIADYFIRGEGDGKFLQFAKLKGIAQDGLKETDLKKCDFLKDNIGGVPIFSSRFVDKLSSKLQSEINFFPIEIHCKGSVETFYLAKIDNYMNLVDYDKSGFRLLTDGSKILDFPVVVKDQLQDFYIARDVQTRSEWVVTETFKNMVEENKLKIKFIEVF